jgi:hypothetical protein
MRPAAAARGLQSAFQSGADVRLRFGSGRENVMVATVLNRIGRSPNKFYCMVGRIVIAVRLWNMAQRLAILERRRRALDLQSRQAILHRLELERRAARLAGQTLIPERGSAPVLVRSMGQAVAR